MSLRDTDTEASKENRNGGKVSLPRDPQSRDLFRFYHEKAENDPTRYINGVDSVARL